MFDSSLVFNWMEMMYSCFVHCVDADTDQETDRLLGQTRTEDDYGFYDEKV